MDTQVNVNFEADKDEMLEDVEEEDTGRLKSTISRGNKKTKGRGFRSTDDSSDRYSGKGGEFEQMDTSGSGPVKSVEGYIVFVMGVHEEATEDDIHDLFSEYGVVKNIQLPLDRRTGFVKGYALLEYETKEEAEAAIKAQNGSTFMDNALTVDWAFVNSSGRKFVITQSN